MGQLKGRVEWEVTVGHGSGYRAVFSTYANASARAEWLGRDARVRAIFTAVPQ